MILSTEIKKGYEKPPPIATPSPPPVVNPPKGCNSQGLPFGLDNVSAFASLPSCIATHPALPHWERDLRKELNSTSKSLLRSASAMAARRVSLLEGRPASTSRRSAASRCSRFLRLRKTCLGLCRGSATPWASTLASTTPKKRRCRTPSALRSCLRRAPGGALHRRPAASSSPSRSRSAPPSARTASGCPDRGTFLFGPRILVDCIENLIM